MRAHLVLGASGLVGASINRVLTDKGIDTVLTYYSYPIPGACKLDVRDSVHVRGSLAEWAPAVVYLTAAAANVDWCEAEPEKTWAINVGGVRNVVDAANEAGATVVFFSSDYVFDGTAGPYCEEDPARPICEYGRQKVIGEQHIALHAHEYLIIRTTGVFGWELRGKNFVAALEKSLRAGMPYRVPVEQIGTPTLAANLAELVVALVSGGARGVFNVVGIDRMSRFELAQRAADAFGLDQTLLIPTATRELGQRAPRPLQGGLVVDKLRRQTGLAPIGVDEGLRQLMAERG